MTSRSLLGEMRVELAGLVGDRVHLFRLELLRASRAGAALVAWLMVALLCVSTTWLALCVAATFALARTGITWPFAMLIVAGVNAVGAALALRQVQRSSSALRMPATMRHLAVPTGHVPAQHDE